MLKRIVTKSDGCGSMAMMKSMFVFWVVEPRGLVSTHQRYEKHTPSILGLQSTRRYDPEGQSR
jgi:hypothetical protein